MSYKVGSLFAGVGGVCQAFKNSGCQVVWANEIDEKACTTYQLNHKDTELIKGDIKKLSKENLEKVDILTAGFPCQPFSQAGHGKGFEDERGQLFFDVIRLLKDLEPKAYFLENVKTLASHNDGETFKVVQKELKKAGYSFIPFILNAAEHTYIPQGRERIYIVGFKDECEYTFDKPIKINKIDNIEQQLLSKLFKIPPKLDKSPKKVKEFLDKSTVLANDIYNNFDNKIHQRVMEAVKNTDTVYQYRRYYVRENKSNVCPTLTANMGGGGHNIPIILDNNIPRRLTPKECFNLQGFPKTFKLPDNIARGQLYKQAGNSVVVPMVQQIAEEMVRVLNGNRIS
ncbi:DNA (cytosine-5-)-methyltransferase [Sulfurimonas sp.]|jgi:DNA (cytosine-5)-methyltransferase 1|uniref:DNA cytosine methyltransferase n=1 Tax=Sulfurimonas sp. TaxID=2022749 RepID=UPI002A36DB5D|nr:DNA (cytosine-5-)-methyltransferase [Sulfurimonas sp.]MDY0123884.1 DNA (cytosine-5-)-methyltransferase [Sulfurimonas sp.]